MKMKHYCSILIFIVFLFSVSTVSATHKVYVIHGYASPLAVVRKLNRYLKKEHYNTEMYQYKSMYSQLDSIGKKLYYDVKKANVDTVSFVTHSMGGLVVRSLFQYASKDSSFPIIYRVVMIAPPNKGAEMADIFDSFKMLKKLLGPNVKNMRTDSSSYANRLPQPNTTVGIVVGMRGKKKGYNPYIKNDNDGFISVEKTRLENESDVFFTKADHLFVVRKKVVLKQTVAFLRNGQFTHQ